MRHDIQLLNAKNIKLTALKDHPQIPVMIDILSRRDHHHILLSDCSSEKIFFSLMETLALQLAAPSTAKMLQESEIVYIDAVRFVLDHHTANDLWMLRDNFRKNSNKRVIFALNQISPLIENHAYAELNKFIHTILFDEQWRLIILNKKSQATIFAEYFNCINFQEPSSAELLALLKFFRTDIENFHHVMIPDETVSSALSMANHYLNGHSRFDEALSLLDSSAARTNANDRHDTSGQFKPIVTANLLAHVVSSRTQIPMSHLHHNPFQSSQFIAAIQRRVFGEEAAITLMSSILQQSCVKLQKKSGPLCSFLFAGPTDVGKTETAYAIADHLFGHASALLHVNLSKSHYQSLTDVKIISQTHEHRSMNLLQAIHHTPYAVVLVENINQAPAGTLDLFKDIFIHGFTTDAEGNRYDFRNAIIIMTTTLGAEKISQLFQAPNSNDSPKSVDLMQLVLNENLHDATSHSSHSITPEELCEELQPLLEAYFSQALLQHLHVIPFVPLDYAALEKMMRLKIKSLAKQLETQFGIELHYAPEVIKFIAHEALWRKPTAKSLDKLLEKNLYSCVAHEILAHNEDKNRPKRLSLQLNENGQMLRCEFVSTSESTVYTI
jgi:ATP-dependent Clp protease ATP-binding subunit ClpA